MTFDKIALQTLNLFTFRGFLYLLAACGGIFGVSYWSGCFRLPFSEVHAYEAIPNSSAFVLELNGYSRATNLLNTAPYSGLQAWQSVSKVSRDMSAINQVFERLQNGKNGNNSTISIEKASILCAALVSKASDFDYLYLSELGNIDLEKLIKTSLDWHPNSRNYNGYELYDLTLPNSEPLTIGVYKGVFLAAREGFLVEYGFDQLSQPSSNVWQNADFQTAYKAANHTQPIVVYQNFSASGSLANLYLSPAAQQLWEPFSSTTSWASLMPSISKYGLEFNGITLPKNSFLQALSGEKAQSDTELGRILPDNTAFFAQFNVGKIADFQHRVNTSDSKADRYFLPYLDNSFAYFLLEPASTNFEDSHVLCFKVAEKEALAESMSEWAQNLGKEEATKYQNFTIQRLPNKDFSSKLFGANMDFLHNPYFIIIDNYIVFANSLQTLEVMVDKYNFNQLLAQDPAYLDFLTHANTHSNAFIYMRPERCFQLIKHFYSENKTEETVQALATQWSVFSQISISIKEKNGVLQLKSLLQPSGSELPQIAAVARQSHASLTWKTELKAAARTQPYLTKNPSNGEFEIVMQDVQNRLYRIDRSGNIVWTVQLDQPILSEIYQVDFFKNKDLHYLFNTKNHIYCLDQYGKSASGYPIPLGSPATNGLLCLDYEGDREYSFYLACANGNWYGFQKSGKPLGGWSPLTMRGYFTRTLQHYRAQNKDYLLGVTNKGTFYTFTRYGSTHFEPKILTAPTLSDIGCDPHSEPIKLSAIDTTGMLNVITLDGHRSNAQLRVGNGVQQVRAAIADIEEDALKEYILIAGKQLAVYGYRNKQLTKWWGADLEDELDDVFTVKLRDNTHYNIVLLSKKQKHLHLLDASGVRYPEFPINATTRCNVVDFFGKGSDVLVGACDNIVYAYSLE